MGCIGRPAQAQGRVRVGQDGAALGYEARLPGGRAMLKMPISDNMFTKEELTKENLLCRIYVNYQN